MEEFKKGWNEEYKCNFCENTYVSASSRRKHEKQIHIANNQLHTCTIHMIIKIL